MNRKQKQTIAMRITFCILASFYTFIFILLIPGLSMLCGRLFR